MKRVVYKYQLNPTQTRQAVRLPLAAKILSVQMQGNDMVLWAMVDPETELTEERAIAIHGTGHAFYYPVTHISTILLNEGALVLHVFEADASKGNQ